MADDLDDEWWLQNNDKQGSEGKGDSDCSHESDNEQSSSTSVDESDEAVVSELPKAKKRKENVANDGLLPEEPKKKKKRKNLTEKLKEEPDTAPIPSQCIEAMKKHFEGKLSAIEWDEINITEDHFCSSSDVGQNPSVYLKLICPKWKKMVKTMEKTNGSPLLLIICPAAIRATQFNREIKDFAADGSKTAKLFGKHLKAADQVKFLQKTLIHIGIGTPCRIQTLIDSGALQMSQVRRIVIDWSWRDQKLRRLVDIPEVRKDLFNLLFKCIIPLFKSNNVKIGLL